MWVSGSSGPFCILAIYKSKYKMKNIKLFEDFWWEGLPTLPPEDISKSGETVLMFSLSELDNWYVALMPTNEVDGFVDLVEKCGLASHKKNSSEKYYFPLLKIETLEKESRPGIAYATLASHNNWKIVFEDASYEEKTCKYELWITGDGGTYNIVNLDYHPALDIRMEDKEGIDSVVFVLKRGKIITLYPGPGGVTPAQKEETISEFLENIWDFPY